jgi:hypothetical protein
MSLETLTFTAAELDALLAKRRLHDTEEATRRANASWTLMCKKMVAAEREACAKVCETKLGPTATDFYGKTYATAIRARSNP